MPHSICEIDMTVITIENLGGTLHGLLRWWGRPLSEGSSVRPLDAQDHSPLAEGKRP